MSDTIKIKLVKSLIGQKPDLIRTAKALGLKRMNQTVEVKKNPAVMGMVNKISFMVEFNK
jgi:large subunit ribosomal protein L30